MQQEKRIVEIKTNERITYSEARQKAKTLPPLLGKSFAEAARSSIFSITAKTPSLTNIGNRPLQNKRDTMSPKKAASEAAKSVAAETVEKSTAKATTEKPAAVTPAAGKPTVLSRSGSTVSTAPSGEGENPSSRGSESDVMEVCAAEAPSAGVRPSQPSKKTGSGRGRVKSPIQFKK